MFMLIYCCNRKFSFGKENFSDIICSTYSYKSWKANKSISKKDEIEFCNKNHLNVDILRNIELLINEINNLFNELGYKSLSSPTISVYIYMIIIN